MRANLVTSFLITNEKLIPIKLIAKKNYEKVNNNINICLEKLLSNFFIFWLIIFGLPKNIYFLFITSTLDQQEGDSLRF